MFTVTVHDENGTRQLDFDSQVKADKVLFDAGIMLPKHCGGNGTCGKCKILLNGNECLACQTIIKKDAVINYSSPKHAVIGVAETNIHLLYQKPLINQGFCAAIDIGTTTVAGYIYKFPECKLVKTICLPNSQVMFGADVISRINYTLTNDITDLQNSINTVINEIVKGYDVEKFVICGNTAMLHFLTAENPKGLATAPYKADRLFGEWFKNKFLVKCASAFIGGDITAAVLASGLTNDKTALLVDIGTNGEMVLKTEDKMICCSTAAGPCFEGAGIECGIPAVSGAISSVSVKNGKITFKTINDDTPVGICGTGIIDAVAALLELGIIDETGYMENNFYFENSSIYLSPKDVRNFQMAKSAIRSGIETLLEIAETSYDSIEKFYISGGFGSYLNIESAIKTGLIPSELKNKAIVLGNGAGAGASMILLNSDLIETSNKIADEMETAELHANAFFMDKYLENMGFN